MLQQERHLIETSALQEALQELIEVQLSLTLQEQQDQVEQVHRRQDKEQQDLHLVLLQEHRGILITIVEDLIIILLQDSVEVIIDLLQVEEHLQDLQEVLLREVLQVLQEDEANMKNHI